MNNTAMTETAYQLWVRNPGIDRRWHAQWVVQGFAKAAELAQGWQRTYPDHEICILPHAGSFPVTAAQWSIANGWQEAA